MNLSREGIGWRGPGAVAVITLLLTACSGTVASPGVSPTPDGQTVAASASVDPLSCPEGLAVGASGALYIAHGCTNRVLAVFPAGAWSIFAGTGQAGCSGDREPATAAELWGVSGVTVNDRGDVYVVECGGKVVRRVSPDGIITTVAGLGGRGFGKGGYSGDGGPATEAELHCPLDAATDSSGNLFITDQTNSVIRRVDSSGVISTFAGGGTVNLATATARSEVPARKARFQPGELAQIEVDSAGNVLIAEENGHRVWKIDPSGNLTAFAGTGQPGFSGDGGPADKAQLNGPFSLAIDGEDNVFIGDYENSRVRRVDPDGAITTVAGNGEVGTGGDGGHATEAQLESPSGMAVDGAGNLYIADEENAIIRIVDSAGIIRTL
jgi:trimeric autotransporter adhesin